MKFLIKFFRWLFQLDWEVISRETECVRYKDGTILMEQYVTYRHKKTGQIKKRWFPDYP